ncbi:hypothetical protein ES731_07980 [Psychroflexus gondwanensis]|uniref:DUF6090 family protein n=1 Tax=Psychroflexus gondwanensis TaxID=251 RepID=UPI0011BDCE85|nr:DUF6090 family protein [Psychroflexus gondwanensis]TXE19528.1 hypothetical protein ES731_07980 [Psychroflexus gondwanensis]
MIKLFRNIRQNLLVEGKTVKYFKYAIGEIILVVIGILIALSINNWNENKKAKTTEIYVLKEVLSNLKEDGIILNEIIEHRQKAKSSIADMLNYLQTENISKDILEKDMLRFLTFERYFPINNAYEVLKSKGLQLSNNKLTTQISRYYDYEQKKINGSILDIENAILSILEDRSGIARFIESLTLNETITIMNYDDAHLKKEIYREIVPFKNNNIGTLNKLIVFYENNQSLRNAIEKELKLLDK